MLCTADIECGGQAVIAVSGFGENAEGGVRREAVIFYPICAVHAAYLDPEAVDERKSLPTVLPKEDASV